MRTLRLIVGAAALLQLTAAYAYIGPGVAAGTLAIILGILSSIILAFVGILWYPIKRLFRGRKEAASTPGRPRHNSQGSGSDNP